MQQRKVSNTYKFVALLGLLVLITIWGCSPTRRLHSNQKLLNKVTVQTDDKSVSVGDAEDYLQQKPNRKLLGFWRFYLQVYNLVDSTKAANDHKERVEKKIKRQDNRNARRDKRCIRRTERYKKRGKVYKCTPNNTNDADDIEAKPFREWIQGIGEPPALYDTLLTNKSVFQLKQYMFNNGYFFATVKDSATEMRNKRVNVFYNIKAGPQYIVDTIKYVATDTALQHILNRDEEDKLVFVGTHFDTDALSDEQDRLSNLIKSKGYYFFNNEFVKVVADTNKGGKKVTVSFIIKNPQVVTGKSGEDSLAEGRHIHYKLGNMTVNLGYDPTGSTIVYDTTTYSGAIYFYPQAKKPLFRPKTIDYHIFLRKDSTYSDRNLDITLNRLSDLRTFKFINIQFNPRTIVDSSDGKGILDYDILLTPTMRRGYSLETQGTNTGGNLGIGATVGFVNKNLFRGEEWLEFKLRGALEFQRLVNDSIGSGARNLFNTQEYGASLTLNIPRGVWPINYFIKDPIKNPRTAITTAFNYQNRPQYLRRAYTLSFGWTWRQNKHTTVTYNPVEINFLNARLDNAYSMLLDTTSQVLLRSFDNALVEAGRVAIVWTNQQLDKRVNYVFWRFGFESSGLLISSLGLNQITIGKNTSTPDITTTAKYIRTDFEIYPNFYLNDKNAIALRGYVGFGLAYGKNTLASLPFAKAFFAGGSNGMRGWLQRSLGPGSFDKSGGGNIDQVGNFKLEFNAEYRLKLFSFLEPALFVDVGNIWLTKPDEERKNGSIKESFGQFGVDYGVGLRLDLSFFLLRLDFARRLYDPGAEYEGKKYLSPFEYRKKIESKGYYNPIVFQLGIGYPF
jgi:hypothetical protein